MSVPDPSRPVQEVEALLRRSGRRLTPQREAVLDTLRATTSHPTAEELKFMVQERLPTISLGTVYRNLQLLVEAGYAQRLPTQQSCHRFDGNVTPHHHVICRECGRIADVDLDVNVVSLDEVEGLTGYCDLTQKMEFTGICERCREGGRD